MTALLDVDADATDLPTRPRRRQLTPRTAASVAVLMALGLVAAVVWGVSLVSRLDARSTDAGSASISTEQAARRDVQLAAASFAANFNNYSVDDIGGYKQRMLPLMTDKFGKSFAYAVDGIVTEVKATKMASSGEVVQTAVSSIDADHATALVVADVDITSALGDRARHFRWKISLVREADLWLIDNFEPVA